MPAPRFWGAVSDILKSKGTLGLKKFFTALCAAALAAALFAPAALAYQGPVVS